MYVNAWFARHLMLTRPWLSQTSFQDLELKSVHIQVYQLQHLCTPLSDKLSAEDRSFVYVIVENLFLTAHVKPSRLNNYISPPNLVW